MAFDIGSMIGTASGFSNPITAIAGVAGLGLQIAGGIKATEAAKASAQASQNIAGLQIQENGVRQQAMELSASRQQMEVLRNNQRARSLALNNATSQGAQFGSGLAGGVGQVSGQSGVNSLGISQNLGFGEQLFGLDSQIDTQKSAIASAQSEAASGQGLSSLGGDLMKVAGPLGNLGGSLFGTTSGGGGGKLGN